MCEPGLDPISGELTHCCRSDNCNIIKSNHSAKVNSCWVGGLFSSATVAPVKTVCEPPNNQYCMVSFVLETSLEVKLNFLTLFDRKQRVLWMFNLVWLRALKELSRIFRFIAAKAITAIVRLGVFRRAHIYLLGYLFWIFFLKFFVVDLWIIYESFN